MARLTNAELLRRLTAANDENVELRARVHQLEGDVARLSAPRGCQCIDCGGDQPVHSPDCAYMRELSGYDEVRMTDRRRLVKNVDTMKRLSIKFRCPVRYNSDSGRYECKLDGEWIDAAAAG